MRTVEIMRAALPYPMDFLPHGEDPEAFAARVLMALAAMARQTDPPDRRVVVDFDGLARMVAPDAEGPLDTALEAALMRLVGILIVREGIAWDPSARRPFRWSEAFHILETVRIDDIRRQITVVWGEQAWRRLRAREDPLPPPPPDLSQALRQLVEEIPPGATA